MTAGVIVKTNHILQPRDQSTFQQTDKPQVVGDTSKAAQEVIDPVVILVHFVEERAWCVSREPYPGVFIGHEDKLLEDFRIETVVGSGEEELGQKTR